MNPDYTPKPYYKVSGLSRKRQIINRQLDELHNMQLDMIDQAVDYSDLRDAQEVARFARRGQCSVFSFQWGVIAVILCTRAVPGAEDN